MITQENKEKIMRAVKDILEAVGEDPNRPGLVETPKRVANMYEEMFAGLDEDLAQHLKLFDESSNDEVVIVRDIPFSSMCEHHLLPFMGKAHIAYIPATIKLSVFQNLHALLTILQSVRRYRKGSQAMLPIFCMTIFRRKALPL